MEQILSELIKDNPVIIEVEKLPDFYKFTMAQKDYYSFRYEYIDQLVKITLTGKDIIIKVNEKLH